jgi:hypothetical protein
LQGRGESRSGPEKRLITLSAATCGRTIFASPSEVPDLAATDAETTGCGHGADYTESGRSLYGSLLNLLLADGRSIVYDALFTLPLSPSSGEALVKKAKKLASLGPAISVVLIIALSTGSMGCASANTKGMRATRTDRLPQPRGIVVYDFEPTASSIGLDAGRDPDEDGQGISSEDLANRREVGRVLADVLAEELEDRGFLTSRKSGNVEVPEGLMAIGGQIVTVEEGSRAKRVFIGFGSGRSRLTSAAQLHGITMVGPTDLWEYQNTAASGAKPGVLTTLPIGVAVQGLTLLVLLLNGGMSAMGELSAASTSNAKRMGKELAGAIEKTLGRVTRR